MLELRRDGGVGGAEERLAAEGLDEGAGALGVEAEALGVMVEGAVEPLPGLILLVPGFGGIAGGWSGGLGLEGDEATESLDDAGVIAGGEGEV